MNAHGCCCFCYHAVSSHCPTATLYHGTLYLSSQVVLARLLLLLAATLRFPRSGGNRPAKLMVASEGQRLHAPKKKKQSLMMTSSCTCFPTSIGLLESGILPWSGLYNIQHFCYRRPGYLCGFRSSGSSQSDRDSYRQGCTHRYHPS